MLSPFTCYNKLKFNKEESLSRELNSPFLFIVDSSYRSVGWALLTAPIVTRSHHVELRDLSQAGLRFAGMTSYMTFPRADPADARDYGSLCEAWCHCFREPGCYLPDDKPRALISYSDFTDYMRVSPQRVRPEASCDYDFIYVGATEPWQRDAKNWALAARCIPRICRDLHLRALVMGTPGGGFEESPAVRFTPHLTGICSSPNSAALVFFLPPTTLTRRPGCSRRRSASMYRSW